MVILADLIHNFGDALTALPLGIASDRLGLSRSVGSAIIVALGLDLGDPLICLAITLVILRIASQSWRTIRASPAP